LAFSFDAAGSEIGGHYFLQVFLHVNVTGNKYYIFTTGTKSIQIATIPFF